MANPNVSTIRSSGGDYTSLSAWWTAKSGDFVTATEGERAECYDDWPSGLSDTLIISGATTSVDYFASVTVASGHRHDGTPQSGFFMKKSDPFNGLIELTDDFTVVEWTDVENTGTLGQQADGYRILGTIGTLVLSQAIGKGGARGCRDSGAHDVLACLFYDSDTGLSQLSSFQANRVENCTISDCTNGIQAHSVSSGFTIAVNNVVTGATTSYVNSAGFDGTNSLNNAADDASTTTPPGTAPITTDIVSGDFVDAANDDWHIDDSGSTLYQAGSNATTAVNDIDDEAFDGTSPSVGFDELLAAAAGGVLPGFNNTNTFRHMIGR